MGGYPVETVKKWYRLVSDFDSKYIKLAFSKANTEMRVANFRERR